MISLLFTGKFEGNMEAKKTCLSSCRKEVDHLLYGASPVHVQRNVDQILSNRFADEIALLVRGVLQKFLTEIIAKWVCKQSESALLE